MQIECMLRQVAASLAKDGYIQEKHIKLYAQGMQIGLAMLLNIITTIIIGIIFGAGWHAAALLAAFMLLRSYAGGYHASGYVKCYLESCLMLVAVMWLLNYGLENREGFLLLLYGVSFILVWVLAPLPDANKPASEEELVKFRKTTRKLLIAESTVGIAMICLGISQGYAVLMAIVLVAFMLLLHRLKSMTVKSAEITEGDSV